MEFGDVVITVEGEAYTFKLTCPGHPEQYDVINSEGEKVGYVRLRYGVLTADKSSDLFAPRYYETEVLGWGSFLNREERMFHLEEIAKIIHSHKDGQSAESDFQKVLQDDVKDVLSEFDRKENESDADYFKRIVEDIAKRPEYYIAKLHRD